MQRGMYANFGVITFMYYVNIVKVNDVILVVATAHTKCTTF